MNEKSLGYKTAETFQQGTSITTYFIIIKIRLY